MSMISLPPTTTESTLIESTPVAVMLREEWLSRMLDESVRVWIEDPNHEEVD